jgi:sigma-B regulation protein RsbU (phosphoserine phosphatase)
MKAAIPVVMFSGILNSQMELGGTLQERFHHLNRSICAAFPGRTFVCLVMAELDIETGAFSLANGACPYPYHYDAKAGSISEMQVGSYFLGVAPNTHYESIHRQLYQGDWLIFCSDGIMEALDTDDNLFGYDRTAALIESACTEEDSAEAVIVRIFEGVDAFRGEAPQSDDLTCVALRVDQ